METHLAGSALPNPTPPCSHLQLIINLKNKPEAVEKIHSFCAIYFCLYMLVFTGVSIRCARCAARVLVLPSGGGAGSE